MIDPTIAEAIVSLNIMKVRVPTLMQEISLTLELTLRMVLYFAALSSYNKGV